MMMSCLDVSSDMPDAGCDDVSSDMPDAGCWAADAYHGRHGALVVGSGSVVAMGSAVPGASAAQVVR